MYESSYSTSSYEKIKGQTGIFNFGMTTSPREGKLN